MIYNVYRLPEFDPDNFKATFENRVLNWVEEISVDTPAALSTHLNANSVKYLESQDIVTTLPRDLGLTSLPYPVKFFLVKKPVTNPIPWCMIIQ